MSNTILYAARISEYTYDDLNRLTRAQTLAATSTPYDHYYEYNAIGNLSSSTPRGAYTYGGTNYANPHAPTQISTTSLTYDNGGNILTYGAKSYTWDYRNRLLQEAHGTATSTYTYDHEFNRVKQVASSTTASTTTTFYPNKYFSITSSTNGATTTATTTDYIWVGDTLVAYIEQKLINNVASGSPITFYVYPDHLGSTNVVTNSQGTIVQALDYYPYGSRRINTGRDVSQREYIGQYFDENSSLNYLNARYTDPARGQFLSQDPVFWEIGKTKQSIDLLTDPQLANSYSYARGNPITYKDVDGRKAEIVYRTVYVNGLNSRGAHTFILITPNAGETHLSIPGYEGQSKITIGGYSGSGGPINGELKVRINDPSDFDLKETQYLARDSIIPADGMSVENYDKLLVKIGELAQENKDNIFKRGYNFLGQPQLTGLSNSNNTTNEFIRSSGGSFEARKSVGGMNFHVVPGINRQTNQPFLLDTVLAAIQGVVAAFSKK